MVMRVQSDCGAANLLAALFGMDREHLKQRWGLPSAYDDDAVCLSCGGTFRLRGRKLPARPFCSPACRYEYTHPVVVCSGCGREFRRQLSALKAGAKRDQQRVFCSWECMVGRGQPKSAFSPSHTWESIRDGMDEEYRKLGMRIQLAGVTNPCPGWGSNQSRRER